MNRGRLGTSGGNLNNFAPGGSLSDDDDLYSGYNEFPSALNTEDLEFDESFQNSARTLESRRPTVIFYKNIIVNYNLVQRTKVI